MLTTGVIPVFPPEEPSALQWPPPRPPVPTYEQLPRVYTENYYFNTKETAVVDKVEGNFVLPDGARLMFMGGSYWSMQRGWEMHMLTVDEFPMSEDFGPETARRMVSLPVKQMEVLHDELLPKHRDIINDFLTNGDFEPQPFIELAHEQRGEIE